MSTFIASNWIWVLGYAISVGVGVWVWKTRIPALHRAFWTLPLLLPFLGPLFVGLAFNPPKSQNGLSGPVDDIDPGRYSD